jgi:HD-like signal output (HDOD) protein
MDAFNGAAYDALVLDGQTTDGVQLLKLLSREIGKTICAVRCNMMDRAAVAHWDRSGAVPVAEDCDAASLVANLKRSARLRDWMQDPALKQLLPKVHKLPASPKLHSQVTRELQSDGSLTVVADLIAEDPVMSAKILQVANSALFGSNHEVTDTIEAVTIMGTERIRALILMASVFSQYGKTNCAGFSPEPIWSHCLQAGAYARAITLAETKDAKLAEAAFTAGLLHDVGKLILVGNLPGMYDAIRKLQLANKMSSRAAELKVMGTTHAEFGACLLATWGLPLSILEAIAWHHEPARSHDTEFSLLAAVHAANVFAHASAPGPQETLDTDYLSHIGLPDCEPRWRDFCDLPQRQETLSPEEIARRRREAKEN